MTPTTDETWWASFSKREQSRRKTELARELDTRGMDIPDSYYGWTNAAYDGTFGTAGRACWGEPETAPLIRIKGQQYCHN